MNMLKRFFIRIVELVTIIVAKIKEPWTKKLLTGESIQKILDSVKSGDFLVVKAEGFLASYLLGDFSHIVYVYDRKNIVDSSHIGLAKRSILDVLVGYSRVAILRPKFTPVQFRKMKDRVEYLLQLDEKRPIKYNYSVLENNKVVKAPKLLTCAQFARDLVNHAIPDYMDLRPRLGFKSIAPNDFYKATKKFIQVREERR